MYVWVFTRLEYTRKIFEFEIWTKEPTKKTSFFKWPLEKFDFKKIIDKELIEALFSKASSCQGYKLFIKHIDAVIVYRHYGTFPRFIDGFDSR